MKSLFRTHPIAAFNIEPAQLRWPWIAFSPARIAMAYPADARTVGIRTAASPNDEGRVRLADGFELPGERQSAGGTTSQQPGLHALAVHDDGRTVAAFAWHDGAAHACIATRDESPRTVKLGSAFDGLGPMAATFSLHGDGLWVSAESRERSMLCRLAWPSLDVVGAMTFSPPPLPAHHELFAHPAADEVLLLMACGQDGTFAQIARFENGTVASVGNARERGGEPAGWCEWDAAGGRVFLVGDGGVEALMWPSLERSAQREPPEGIVFRYAGLRVDERLVLSATDEEAEDDDRALVYDVGSLEQIDDAPAPKGMWAGRLGADALVTIGSSKGKTRPAEVHRVEWLAAKAAH